MATEEALHGRARKCLLHDQWYAIGESCPDCRVLEPNYGEEAVQEKMVHHEREAAREKLDFYDGVSPRGRRVDTTTVKSANDIQHGGDHYKNNGAIQHWDLVAQASMDYYIGNATKYLSRGHKKNGREDYAKAGHYIQKRGELGWDTYIRPEGFSDNLLWEFCIEQKMPPMAIRAFFSLMLGRPGDAREAAEWLSLNYEP